MDPGFGFAQSEEDGGSSGLGASAEGSAGDHFQDVRKVAVLRGRSFGMDAESRRRDSTADGFLDFEPSAGIEAMQGRQERLGRSPGVEQSADGHVAANS
jgi:hypothetical protein